MSRSRIGRSGAVRRSTTQRRVFEPLKVRDFALLWIGQSVSSVGDGIFTVALAIVTLEIDHSPTGLAIVFAARVGPSVCFALVGGVVVDRVSRRFALLSSDLTRGAAVCVIAVFVARGSLQLWHLIVMSAIFGAADAIFGPASMAIVPELLDGSMLAQGNALGQMSSQLAQGLIGPAFGGVIVGTIGAAWSFGVDAMSFGVSGVCLIAMRVQTGPRGENESPLADARNGLRYVRERNWLRVTLLGAALANFIGIAPLAILMPLLVRTTLHGSATELGLVFATGGTAGVVVSLVVAKIGSPRRRVTATWAAYTAGSIPIALMALSPNVYFAAIFLALEVGFILYGDILWVAMMQELVPQEFLGRVSSLVYLFAFSLGPLGMLAGGLAAALIGVRATLLLSGLISGTICAVVMLIPGVRDPELERESRTDNFGDSDT